MRGGATGKEKHWYKDWRWWVGEGVIVGAFIVDAHSTVLARDSCPGCRETNLLLGSRPGNRALIIHSGLFFALESALHVGSWQVCPDPNREYKSWHIACDTSIPAIVALTKIPAAVSNYNIAASHSSSSQSLAMNVFRQSHGKPPPALPSWSGGEYSHKPFYMPRPFSDCDHDLVLCDSSQPTTAPKIDLRSVQFR